ncbi:MAG: hypothetical protein E7660_03965 [Ruminococcaceae bacterium]|nr:hypothetical protein [Oscillospiraceae bacterium]
MYKFSITDEPFAVGYLTAESDSIYVRCGRGYVELAKTMNISVDGKLGLPLCGFEGIAVAPTFSGGQSPSIYWLEVKEKNSDTPEDYRYIIENMKGVDTRSGVWDAFTENEKDIINSVSGWGGTWGGHAVPDLIDFAILGTDGIREKIYKYQKINGDDDGFYEGLLLTLDAVDILGRRLHALAKDMLLSAEDEKTAEKLQRVANTFEHCPVKPALSFAEAVCVYVMLFTLDGIDSPGHFDLYMKDFWERSDYDESREALEDLWMFFHNTRTWNLCISGSDEKGNDLSNPLTYEILEVARKYKFNTPNLTMRCHKNTPLKLWESAYETIALGMGLPALYNDGAVCPALISLGIPPEDAHLYVMNGCNQIDVQGKSHMGLEDGEVNLGMAVRYALFNGYNTKLGKRIGVETGDASDFDTFEKFYGAVKEQITFLCDTICAMSNKAQKFYAEKTANPLRSMTIEGCIEKGRDYKNKGPLYGHGQILAEGVPDAVNSVANIKKLVYEEKRFTLEEVRKALEADFEGYEFMYSLFRSSPYKFGNDNDFVDEIAADLINFYNGYLRTIPTYRGGFFSGGCSPFDRAARNGAAVGALPSGKRDSETLYGDSIGAVPGSDVKGPTALLSSCLKLDHTLPASGFILNLKFDRALFNSPKGKEAFLSLCRGYFDGGGQQLSVTVVSAEELLDAVKNPDAHRNIIVRVGGYSDYFVNLTPELQENVIERTVNFSSF